MGIRREGKTGISPGKFELRTKNF